MYLFRILIVASLFLNFDNDSGWKLRKDKSGITVYTRVVEGSSFEEFKAITILPNTSVTDVLDVISDIKNYTSLMPDCISAKILLRKGNNYNIHYFSVKAPWPVKNRDGVYEATTTISDNNKTARIELKPLGNYIEEEKNFIRLKKGTGYWELEEIDTNATKVTYQFHGDPEGKVPAWLANSYVVSNPFQTFINLKSILKNQ